VGIFDEKPDFKNLMQVYFYPGFRELFLAIKHPTMATLVLRSVCFLFYRNLLGGLKK
jgi:hypothetical protein